MHIYAQIESLIYPLQELQDRVSLEVPAAFVKEESIRESDDQHIATYAITYYGTEDNDPQGESMDVKKVVAQLAKDVMRQYPEIHYETENNERARNTTTTSVIVTWSDRQASYRRADAPLKALPLTIYAQEDVYNIASAGGTFSILKNGEAIEDDLPSPAFALGVLINYLQDDLTKIEAAAGLEASPPTDFLAGIATNIVNTPDLPDEAKEHFVDFYELVTLKEFPN